MGTRGKYGVIREDHYYLTYQHYDMYPAGHPQELFQQAQEIAENGEWDQIIEGWTAKTWVDDMVDNDVPASRRSHIAHPDGNVAQRGDWVYAMRPRESYEDMVADDKKKYADEIYTPGADHAMPVVGKPDFRLGAEMSAMMKEPIDALDREYGVFVDADNNEIVLCSLLAEGFEPLAVAPLDDPDAIQSVSDWMETTSGKRIEDLDPPPTIPLDDKYRVYPGDDERRYYHSSVGGPETVPLDPYDTYQQRFQDAMDRASSLSEIKAHLGTTTGRFWKEAPETLYDGQWLRPRGFSKLDGTPHTYPAKHYAALRSAAEAIDVAVSDTASSAAASGGKQGRRNRFSAAEQRKYAELARRTTTAHAAETAGVSASTIYQWRRKHGV